MGSSAVVLALTMSDGTSPPHYALDAADAADADPFSRSASSAPAAFSSIASSFSASFFLPASLDNPYLLDLPSSSPVPLNSPPPTTGTSATDSSHHHQQQHHHWPDTHFHTLHHTPSPLTPPPSRTPATASATATASTAQPAPAAIPAVHVATAHPWPAKLGVATVTASVVRERRRELKRRKQRDSDSQRRQRENAALARLQQLLADEEDEPDTVLDDADRSKRCKADVLEQSVQRIEQLQMLLAQVVDVNKRRLQRHKQLVAAVEDEDDEEARGGTSIVSAADTSFSASSTTSSFYQRLPPFVSWMLGAQMRREGLDSSTFMASSVCLLLCHIPTGLVADASERYLYVTSMDRSHLVGRRYLPPRPTWIANPLLLADRSQYEKVPDRPMRSGRHGEAEETKQEPQYERSLRLLGQLLEGTVDVIDAVWRAQQGDGHVYEKRVMTWVSEWDERSQPVFIMNVVSTQSIIRMD